MTKTKWVELQRKLSVVDRSLKRGKRDLVIGNQSLELHYALTNLTSVVSELLALKAEEMAGKPWPES